MSQLPTITDPRLLVGSSTSDDAAVYKINEDTALVSTVDFFPPIVDDPYLFGAISASNSLSDVYAMGGTPLIALNIVGFPSDLDFSILSEILKGGVDKAKEANTLIVGGHTINDAEPKYGLAVTGIIKPGHQVTNIGARPGDHLILTKPLGTGIITTAAKQNKISQETLNIATKNMAKLNKQASEIMTKVGVNACSDITGFGLLGHLKEMASNDSINFEINMNNIPVIDGTWNLINQGIVPGGTIRNLESIDKIIDWGNKITEEEKLLLCDAQTSGGLLISVPQEKLDQFIKECEVSEQDVSVIGVVKNKTSINPIKIIK